MLVLPSTTNAGQTFNEIYDAYGKVMLKVARRIIKDPYLAEDAVQEALLRISKNIDKVGDIFSPESRGYVLAVTRNASLTILKIKKGIVEMEEPLLSAEHLQESGDIEQDIISKVSYEALVSTIRKLPKIYADVLYLDWVMNFSIKEISEHLDASETTIKKRINRGRKLLMSRLNENSQEGRQHNGTK